MKLGLEQMQQLCHRFGNPQKTFQTIHVAGTNGKGSVVTKMAVALQSAGYLVGLYTSPHISTFRERIQINQKKIDEASATKLLTTIFNAEESKSATFFEITTLLSFLYFAEQNVDVAVIETGLGGRLDATNVIHPLLSLIISISLEHTEILGNTLEQIALEKAGIIKPYVPVVIGPRVPHDIISSICKEKHVSLFQVQGNFDTYDEENSAIAKKGLELLRTRFEISDKDIAKGIQSRPPCRFEILEQGTVVLDVAHNPDGFIQLQHFIRKYFSDRKIRYVCGISKTKDVRGCFKILNETHSDIHLVCGANGRGVPVDELKEMAVRAGIDKIKLHVHATLEKNLSSALEIAKTNNELVVVCGSFFIMQQVRSFLGLNDEQDVLDLNEKKVDSSGRSGH
jgi:dihydrofolate synthase/folylpolyglutamate synthase